MPIVNFEIGGLNNRQDPIKLGKIEDFRNPVLKNLTSAVNVDLDNAGLASVRGGRTLRLAGTPHSLWVHPKDNTLAYFVEDSVLKKFETGFTATTIATLSSNLPMAYEVVNDQVVASNASDIGWLEASAFTPFAPTLGTFESAMPAGQYLGFYKGSLYVAVGSVIYASKPWNAERVDPRHGIFPMGGYIRMLAAVEDGLWVATERQVAFIQGGGPDEFVYREKTDNTPPDGGFSVGWEEGPTGVQRVVRWSSKEGFCTGKAGGAYENLSADSVALPSGESGACFHRVNNGTEQYVAVIRNPGEDDSFTAPSLVINSITVS